MGRYRHEMGTAKPLVINRQPLAYTDANADTAAQTAAIDTIK